MRPTQGDMAAINELALVTLKPENVAVYVDRDGESFSLGLLEDFRTSVVERGR